MKKPLHIMVCGDTHGYWALLSEQVKEVKPSFVIQCGDFGFWPGNRWYSPSKLHLGETKVHWCDGNHENFEKLAKRKSDETHPGVFYHPRGSAMLLPDGRTVFFCGGAESHDKASRKMGFDWFPEEIPNYAESERILDAADRLGHADIIVSHTCPVEFEVDRSDQDRLNDPTRKLLSMLLEMLRPSLWYFGHWHIRKEGDAKGCHWTALNKVPDPGWWTWLR